MRLLISLLFSTLLAFASGKTVKPYCTDGSERICTSVESSLLPCYCSGGGKITTVPWQCKDELFYDSRKNVCIELAKCAPDETHYYNGTEYICRKTVFPYCSDGSYQMCGIIGPCHCAKGGQIETEPGRCKFGLVYDYKNHKCNEVKCAADETKTLYGKCEKTVIRLCPAGKQYLCGVNGDKCSCYGETKPLRPVAEGECPRGYGFNPKTHTHLFEEKFKYIFFIIFFQPPYCTDGSNYTCANGRCYCEGSGHGSGYAVKPPLESCNIGLMYHKEQNKCIPYQRCSDGSYLNCGNGPRCSCAPPAVVLLTKFL
ncbi:hypothetical protein PRIPAC_90827 [Pristionchus pacificus]|uniref:Uncharacterized protein n=1 Tax=Pristionchus pacificus TaxID=54126 RepID=A0A2A6CT33_PRIPA|nr:hypothetical protein PRIPAC_90827 [Pristionchus pacificus]|eukprot:PDM81384.1 hypothetical protein PRIPAC_35260 [Pristionchus pacificus]